MLEQLDPPLDGVLHALADPGRRRMVERLTLGPTSVSDLARPFDMSLSGVLQHLRVLEDAGLARSEKQGRVRTYHIQPAALVGLEQWVAQRKAEWERRFDRLERLLELDDPTDPHADRPIPDHTSAIPDPDDKEDRP